MSIKSIIFDFDGTLFDTMSIWETAGADYLSSLGYASEKDLGKKLKEMSLMQSAAYLREHYGLPMSAEEILSGVNKTVEDFYFYRAMPKENVLTALAGLREKGIKLCIATATDRYLVEAALKRCGLFDCFDAIFTCTEAGHGKDEPYIFEAACEAMGAGKSATAVFEDSYHAAKTAKGAGFFLVGVYDRYEKRTAELKALADLYINSFDEVGRLFETK